MAYSFYPGEPDAATLDPVVNFDANAMELLRCCLARTLLSFNGEPSNKGGSDPRPDLATRMPDVSADGLEWTFHIRSGIHYAPPLQHTEIVAADFVRSLVRQARLNPPQNGGVDLSVIRGYDDFAAGKTSSITGLETPDTHTLVIRLTAPAGDLGYRLDLSFMYPLPALPSDPSAPYGVASGHDAGDSAFLVSSGPYMVQGSDALDFSRPPAQQRPAAGLVPGKSLTLVRNPAWRAADDTLRPAYVDRVVVTWSAPVGVGNAAAQAANATAAVDHGAADLYLPGPGDYSQPPPDQIKAYQADPHKGRIEVHPVGLQMYLHMNLAVPPFDDVHVRRAVAYAIDRKAVVASLRGGLYATPIGHVAVDDSEDNALLNYDPYRVKDAATGVKAAKVEMALSRYDQDHDGICDVAACQHISALGDGPKDTPRAGVEANIAATLAGIGLGVDMHIVNITDFFNQVGDPTSRTAMGVGYEMGMAYPNAEYLFSQMFAVSAISNYSNYSLVGATPDQLRSWGYSVTMVPSVDDRIAQCVRLVGATQKRCWTVLDQYVTENVVAVVPLVALNTVEVIPSRVVSYSYDDSASVPALDHVALQH